MTVKSISVNGMRLYDLYTAEVSSVTTLIIGKNGSGKTTLLEAIYLLHRGTTFRGRDRDVIPHESSAAEIKLTFSDSDSIRRLNISLQPGGKITKKFTIGEKVLGRMPTIDRLPVVLFEPDELRLLTSSPQRRRDFIDAIIMRLSPTYTTVINRFQRTLLQRNELLKQYESMTHSIWESHLFAWDVKFAELSASIIKARANFIIHSNTHLPRLYSQLASEDHTVTARYMSEFKTIDDSLQQCILRKLESTRQTDAIRGYTTSGPHRDDIELLLDDHPASETASRGEMRTIMLAFKLLEVELQEHHSGQKPLILLDDVFSELDTEREQKLLQSLANFQTIITATDLRNSQIQDSHTINLS